MNLDKRNEVFFPALLNEIFRPDWFGGIENSNKTVPAANIIEREKEFELQLLVPGRSKEDFVIEVDKDLLTISSEVKEDLERTEDKFTRKEFSLQSFKRAFTLPKTINGEKIEASYNNGILTFNLPKKEEALPKPKRLIELA